MAWQDPLSTAASISNLLQIASQITQFSYRYFCSVRDAHTTRAEYLRESRALVVVLLQLGEVLNSDDVQKQQDATTNARRVHLSAAMSDCENGLKKIEATLGKAMGFWGMLWPLQQEQIRDHIKTFQRYRGMLDSFVSANVLATTAATLAKIDPLVLSNERNQLLFAFPRPDTISKPRVTTCYGTGKWFLESTHYGEWLDPSSSVGLIWCHGPPGVGKSGLASLVVDQLLKRQRLDHIHLCYFFCDFAAREKQSLIKVLQCLVYQLIEQGNGEAFNCAKESLGHFDAFQDPNILAKVIAKISGLSKPIFLVLDAEDELDCRDKLKKYMLSFKDSGCRILITSRDRSPCGSSTTTLSPVKILELRMECPIEDIVKYTTNRFQESPFQPQISSDLVNQIAQKANGIFLIAHIHIEHLLQQTSVLAMRKLLENSPTEMIEVFESSLRRINDQPPVRSRLAHRVIGWIINSRQLLTVEAMAHGFAVEEGMDEVNQDGLTNSDTISRVCAGLVIIDETKTVRMVHSSVYEFFRTRKAGLREVQVDIAQSCMRYLCLKPMLNGPAKDLLGLRKRLEELPFLYYASHYWGAHIQDESSEEQLHSLILGLLTNENTRWSAVQSLHFSLEVGYTTIATDFFASIPTHQQALHLSAYWGLSLICRDLIGSGANRTPRDSELWTPLHWAAAKGHDRAVNVLVEAKSDLDAKDSEGWTPLFWASFHGNIFTVQILLRAGANHQVKSNRGFTALDWSIWRDELEIARTLLLHNRPSCEILQNKSNSNVTMQDLQDIGKRFGLEYFRGPEYNRAYRDHWMDDGDFDDSQVEFPTRILKLGDVTSDVDSTYPIFHGYRSRSTILDIYGQFGPPVSKSIWRTWSKFTMQESKKELLMKNPAAWKSNLLQSAILTGDLAPARLLVELGADVNAKGDGLCPIFAALNADDPQFLELLITNGADASFIHEGHNMATKVVCGHSKEKPSLMAMVLKHGANPNHIQDNQYQEVCSPLMCAARGYSYMSSGRPYHNTYIKQPIEMCEVLVTHGAEINARNPEGKTALSFSVERGNVKIIKLLLLHGADVNALDQDGHSALHIAARCSRSRLPGDILDIHQLLLEHGANENIKSNAGMIPFRLLLDQLQWLVEPRVSILQGYVQQLARFGLSPRDLVAVACADGEATKSAAKLGDVATLEYLLSHGGALSDDSLRNCIYSSIDETRPCTLRLLMGHSNLFGESNNKHLAFLVLIKISRGIHRSSFLSGDHSLPIETRVQTAKPLPLRYPRYRISVDRYCDILKEIWDAGFDANTTLDENFVNAVCTYDNSFGNLVRDAEQFGDPSSPEAKTISAVGFAAQHVTSPEVVLALPQVNSRRNNFTDQEILEVFIRSAVYDSLEVYDACRRAILGQANGNSAKGGQTQGALERPVSPELRSLAEVFPSYENKRYTEFYKAFYEAVRTESFDEKTCTGGRTLFELAERAKNKWLLESFIKQR